MSNLFKYSLILFCFFVTSYASILETSPVADEPNAAKNTWVKVNFTEPMDETSVFESFKLKSPGGGWVAGSMFYNSNTYVLTFKPTSHLSLGSAQAIVSKSIKNASGTTILQQDHKWDFTVGDYLAPELVSTSLVSSEVSVRIGQATELSVTGHFSDGTTRDLTQEAEWMVSNVSLATVDANGTLHALAEGSVGIETKTDGIISNATTVDVVNVLEKITLSPTSFSIPYGNGSQTVAVQGTYSDTSTSELTSQVSYVFSDPGILSIDSTGHITVLKSGSTDVRAEMDGITSSSISITVYPIPTDIELTPSSIELVTGKSIQLAVTQNYNDGSTLDITNDLNASSLSFQVADGSVAHVSGNGVLTALLDGNTSVNIVQRGMLSVSNEVSVNVLRRIETLSPAANIDIPYSFITFEVNASNTARLTALNQRLANEQNRTININGVQSQELYYFYNIPLLQGDNEITLTSVSDDNRSVSKLINITSAGEGYPPIGMRTPTYEGVVPFQTTVETGTSLTVQEYLFDSDGNGVIDETSTDGNFSVNFTAEGRYKPRVTIRTQEGPLYSSWGYALSLDAKADVNQTDPTGAEPLDVAKAFVAALLDNDRLTVETLLGHNQKLIGFIYADPARLESAKAYYKNIVSWEQTYHNSGYATVKVQIANGTQTVKAGFELNTVDLQIRTGRFWRIRTFY